MKTKLLCIALVLTLTPGAAQAGSQQNDSKDWWCSFAKSGFTLFWSPCKTVNR